MIKIINFRDSNLAIERVISFFNENDSRFFDPFSLHVNIDEYTRKLCHYGEVFLAIENDRIVGMACAYMNDMEECIAHLQAIVVCSNYEGKGIGHMLIAAVFEEAISNNMRACMLTIDVDNDRAERFYRSIGFVNSKLQHIRPKKKYMICYFV